MFDTGRIQMPEQDGARIGGQDGKGQLQVVGRDVAAQMRRELGEYVVHEMEMSERGEQQRPVDQALYSCVVSLDDSLLGFLVKHYII